MAKIAKWNGHSFEVSKKLIRSIEGLSIKGSCETEDKTKDGKKFVSRTNSHATQISFTVQLNALMGVTNVRKEAMKYVKQAENGETAHFYIGSEKLMDAKLMLTSAEVEEIAFLPAQPRKWISCSVKLTFKRGSNDDGSTDGKTSGGSGGGGGKKSGGGGKSGGEPKAPFGGVDVGEELTTFEELGGSDPQKPGEGAEGYFGTHTGSDSGAPQTPTGQPQKPGGGGGKIYPTPTRAPQ